MKLRIRPPPGGIEPATGVTNRWVRLQTGDRGFDAESLWGGPISCAGTLTGHVNRVRAPVALPDARAG